MIKKQRNIAIKSIFKIQIFGCWSFSPKDYRWTASNQNFGDFTASPLKGVNKSKKILGIRHVFSEVSYLCYVISKTTVRYYIKAGSGTWRGANETKFCFKGDPANAGGEKATKKKEVLCTKQVNAFSIQFPSLSFSVTYFLSFFLPHRYCILMSFVLSHSVAVYTEAVVSLFIYLLKPARCLSFLYLKR